MTNHRRNFLIAAASAVAFAVAAPAGLAAAEPQTMTAPEALEAATSGGVVLVDIRSREEWQQTGVAEPALPISMHEGGFVQKLLQAMDGDPSRRVALICATGGRTRYVQNVLASNGFSNVIDVAEGMMSSPAGPGWLKRGLPVKPWKPE
jgi:rhodanese-related sulfurtransferase